MSITFGESKLGKGLSVFFANSERSAGINVQLEEAELELLRPVSIVLTELVVAGALAVTMSKTGVVRAAGPSDFAAHENKNRIVLQDNAPRISGGDGGSGDDDPKANLPKIYSESRSKNAENISAPTLTFGSFTGADIQYSLGHVGHVVPDVSGSKFNLEMREQVADQLAKLGYDPSTAIISNLELFSNATRIAAEEGRAPRAGVRQGNILFISTPNLTDSEGDPDLFVVGAKDEKGKLTAITPETKGIVMTALSPDGDFFGIAADQESGGFVKILKVGGGAHSHATAGLVLPNGDITKSDEVITAISHSVTGTASLGTLDVEGVFAAATPVSEVPEIAQEIITAPRGLELTIGAPIVGQEGAFLIENMRNGKDLVALNGDVKLGFKPEDNQWVYIKGQDGTIRVVLQRVSDSTQIAELKPSGTLEWDWNQLVDSNGESIFFNGAKVLEKKAIASSLSAQTQMINSVINDIPGDISTIHWVQGIVYSRDGKRAVLVDLAQRGDDPDAGFVFIRGSDGKPIVLWTANFDLSLPPVTR